MDVAPARFPDASVPALDRSVRVLFVALGCGLLGMGLLFAPEAMSAVGVWSVSTAYSHCFFVLPIALYLAWDRRAAIAATPIEPWPAAALIAVPLACGWILAERLGIMEGRQLIVICLLQILFLTLFGHRMWRTLSAPLLYLFFLVPFGAFLTPALQHFTARFVMTGLDLLGIPNFSDEFQIEIPEGSFYVAEACAGLRFLIASIAFGVLYACLIYRSPKRRLMFIAVSMVVPIIANGFRALGIVALGHIIGSAEAAATDHIVYGWLFFSAVILLLVAGGLPFREDQPNAIETVRARPDRPLVSPRRAALIVAGLLALFSAGPVAAALLDRAAGVPASPIPLAFSVPGGCSDAGASPAAPQTVAGAPAEVSHVNCGGAALTITAVTFSPRANPSQFALAERALTGEDRAEDAASHVLHVAGANPETWRETDTGQPARVTASVLWINGSPAPPGLRGRALQAINSIAGARFAPMLVAVSLDRPEERLNADARNQADAVISTFIAGQQALGDQVRALSALARR